MSSKPIYVMTHPRACSTAFERVFMACRDQVQTVHEPFGDPWYMGPERIHTRFENDDSRREESGYGKVTFKSIFDNIQRDHSKDKRIFIKDMAQCWMPVNNQPVSIAPSLVQYRRGVGTSEDPNAIGDPLAKVQTPSRDVHPYPFDTETEEGNPTVIPEELLKRFHYTFLIRHPRYSIPSYYRCTVPPLAEVTGFHDFRPDEAGYAELRRFFDYACKNGLVGPKRAGEETINGTNGVNGHANGANGHSESNSTDSGSGIEICVVDADDLLDNPYGIIQAYCKSIGVEYSPKMLKWNADDQAYCKTEFEKWRGFHEDAIHSDELKPRTHKKKVKSDKELMKEWTEKYGKEGAKVIMQTVKDNEEHYEYLAKFAIKVPRS